MHPIFVVRLGVTLLLLAAVTPAAAQQSQDPRVGLAAGWLDAGEAQWNMLLVSQSPPPSGFVDPDSPGGFPFANTDLAFRGNHVYMGNYNGFLIYDVSDPASPKLRTAFECPGGQGDLSVHGNLLFMSVEEMRGRVDCGTQGTTGRVDPERFRGVRIFDISNLDRPVQVAAVQTCRGSHTHTLVSDPSDDAHIYVYVSGTSVARPAEELAGCSDVRSPEDTTTSYWSIAIIKVPLDAPHEARVVSEPRVFSDYETGEIAGLWAGGQHGPGTQRSAVTDRCHDITTYPDVGLGGGACSGNGILFDISDPTNPVRLDEVTDPNFAYWHSATFNNDGSVLIFTDEWGGGRAPRCRAEDPPEWGANAIFAIVDGRLVFQSYYKLPAPQTAQENCVAHNGSLIPVPGRDIKVQAWYQGGVSVFDFTDPANPFEIAFFDRGPLDAGRLELGGYWSTYWYNGYIYGSEIARGLDVFRLEPGEHLSENEIAAAKLVTFDEFNPQEQPRLEWPASSVVAQAYLDQLLRADGLRRDWVSRVRADLARAERSRGGRRQSALLNLAVRIEADIEDSGDPDRVRALAEVIRQLAEN